MVVNRADVDASLGIVVNNQQFTTLTLLGSGKATNRQTNPIPSMYDTYIYIST